MIKPLRHLFAAPLDACSSDHVIAFDGKEQLTWAALCARVIDWEKAFAGVDDNLVALYERDTIEFLAALFALWRLGKKALIPANNLPVSCKQLAELTPYFAGDFDVVGVITPAINQKLYTSTTLNLTSLQLAQSSLPKLAVPDIHTGALVLFTSGSTSAPIPIVKSFAQLEAELVALETQWGAGLAGITVTSTVSHHHIYGLLFRLLWPLCANRPFVRKERDYWEELVKDAETYSPLVIVSSPAHLSRIPPLIWQPESVIQTIFCSGAPLATEAALNAQAQLNHSVIEVYGSTETGGIAWREQNQNTHWTCLPGVEINLAQDSSLLQVRSAHLPDCSWFNSADKVILNEEGRFSLCGRADRIAKVGGKRISLSAIERILEQETGVAEVRVVLLPDRGDRLGAVVVLDNHGNKRLVDQGKTVINQQFKSALENQIDRIAIPRYWRYLGELPQNRQGKTTLTELEALFASEPLPRLPTVINKHQALEVVTLELVIPANLYYFDGHFPGRPVLPGVVQTHWAVHYGREQWGDMGEFTALEALKFQQVITANQTLLLQLEYVADKNKLYFNYTSNTEPTKPFASGRVSFQREPFYQQEPANG